MDLVAGENAEYLGSGTTGVGGIDGDEKGIGIKGEELSTSWLGGDITGEI